MLLMIHRTAAKEKHLYAFSGISNLYAEANYTFGAAPQSIAVSNSNGEHLYLRQTNRLLKLLNAFPVINTKTLTPFLMFLNESRAGKIHACLFSPVFLIEFASDRYELRLHSDNYCSLMRNNVQVALFQKDPCTVAGQRKYSLFCSDSIGYDFALLICAFADVTFFRNRNSASFVRCETTITFGKDKYLERTQWQPT